MTCTDSSSPPLLGSACKICLLQALGASERDLERQMAPNLDTFIALGDLKALTANQGAPPLLAASASAYGRAGKLQSTIISQRFRLASGELPKVLFDLI